MKHFQILTIKPWKEDKNAPLYPIIITVSYKISINATEHEEFINQNELHQRLESYSHAARAGGVNPKIHLRITPKANDKIFYETLNSALPNRIKSIQIEEIPK